MTMYSKGMWSPMFRSSTLGTTVVEVVLDVDVDVEVDVEVDVDVDVLDVVDDVDVVGPAVVLGEAAVDVVVLVVDSSVTPTENVASGSTTNTCGSFFKRRTSLASSSATKPFTLLENTSLTSLPSDSSLLTFEATLAFSVRITT
ncbi:MAG: hypothetical protein EBS71_02110 [Actinobacteria bacterium]|nr:hypothetical protein [Actinomycetota bacterium]NDF82195.1 hypothetical protein [Actinomycetota bacterium]